MTCATKAKRLPAGAAMIMTASLLATAGAASAATYAWTFHGTKLTSDNGQAILPGTSKITMTYNLTSAIAPNSCIDIDAYPNAYTDGAYGLTALAGLEFEPKNGILNLCVGPTGKEATSSSVQFVFEQTLIDNSVNDYLMSVNSTGSYVWLYHVASSAGGTISFAFEGKAPGGYWTLKVLP